MADISFIKDVKSLKINGEPSHEYELGNDLMRVGGVRQTPRPNNVPVFRDNGYQLDFTVATGGNINFNGIDYPQSTLITSFEAEGKTWLLNEFSGNTIKSETGETATLSVNEGDEFLDSDVWQKKSFDLELDRSNNEYIDLGNLYTISEGTSLQIEFIFKAFFSAFATTQSGLNNNFIGISNTFFQIKQSDGQFNQIGYPSALRFSVGDKINLEIRGENGNFECYINGSFANSTPITSGLSINTINNRLNDIRNSEILSFKINGEKYYLREGLGNELIGSDGTTATIETSHVDGMSRINYGMWKKGNDVDGWVSYD